MRILEIGGGVVGVTIAHQLQRDGHEVVRPTLQEAA